MGQSSEWPLIDSCSILLQLCMVNLLKPGIGYPVLIVGDIYHNEAMTKSYVYLAAQPDMRNIFTVADKSEHRPRRKLISQVLSDQSMRRFESRMAAHIDVFLQQLLNSKSSAHNMTSATRHLGLDIAGKLGFGYDLDLQTNDTNRSLTRAMTLGNWRTHASMESTTLALLRPSLIMKLFPSSLRVRLMNMLMTMIQTRLAKPADAEHDMLSVYAEQSDIDIKNIKQQSLWAESVFFLAAGGETIASTLSATYFYLSRNAEAYEKLAAEIRTTFSSSDEICGGPKLSGCRYLRACIDESMRMSPPVPATLWREAVSRDQPLIVDGHVIPPGTQVGVNIYSLHHNEEYFPDSFRYEPERWLSGAKPGRAQQAAFSPFSMGSRGCAGKSMAYLEMSLVLAKTFWYFDFDRAPAAAEKIMGNGISGVTHQGGEQTEFPIYNLFAASHDGPILEFRPRGNCCNELR
ncbi:hypothetical protein E8E14_006454 [Neopestalotiopsis sp. 37M]|nr:hypothetical protein E8E14_006454 [Neopestalotiopsis sp. 37M]